MNCKIILPPNNIYKLPAIPASYDELMREIHMRLSTAGKETSYFHLKYMDAENELVTLATQEDLTTAILSCEAEQLKCLKIHVFITESPKNKIKNLSMNCNGTIKIIVKAKSDKKIQLEEVTPVKNEETIKKETPKTTPKSSVGANFGEVTLNNQQIEAIKDFVGSKVMKAIEANMKSMMPEFIAKIQNQNERNHIDESVVRDLSKSFAQELNQSLNSSRNILNFSTDEKQMLNSAILTTINTNTSLCLICKEKGKEVRYICPKCSDYKCCETCEEKIKHEHPLLKLRPAETNNAKTNMKANFNMRFSASGSPKNHHHFISSGCKSFSMSNLSEKKICYKGAAYLGNNQDQTLRLGPNENYSLTINVKNIGKATWPESVRLSCVNGAYRGKDISLKCLEPGEKQSIVLRLKTPKKAGRHLSQWRLYFEDLEAGKQKSFGESLFLEVLVDKDLHEEEESKEQDARTKEIMKMADYLNDIYPGDFEEKVDFVKRMGCVGEMDMCKVVEMYLQEHVRNLRGKKGHGCRPENNKLSEKYGNALML